MITGAVGLAQAIGGVLYAPIIDKVNHVKMIKYCVPTYILISIICIICIHIEHYWAIVISQILLGLLSTVYSPTISTIISNCTNSSQRVGVNTNLSQLRRLGWSVGPIISACLYFYLGNTWQIWICQLVVYTG